MSFSADELEDGARAATGLDDFGSSYYREGLERTVDALNTEADLNELGRMIQHATISNALIQRLKIIDTYKQHPEIADEVVEGPVVILGLPRTGTTALGQLVANDPQFRSLRTWESQAPVPPPQAATQHTDPRIAQAADARLREETRVFNEQIAGGKWRHIIALEPADSQWSSMRIAPWVLPQFPAGLAPADTPANVAGVAAAGASGFIETGGVVSIEAAHFSGKVDRGDTGWRVIPGLGRTGDAVAVFPTTAASVELTKLATDAPRLDFQVSFSTTGELTARLDLLPTQPVRTGAGLRLAVALDDQAPQILTTGAEAGSPAWAQSVLNEVVSASVRLRVPTAGAHVLRVFMVDAGVVLDKILIDCGGLKPSYLGPPETCAAK